VNTEKKGGVYGTNTVFVRPEFLSTALFNVGIGVCGSEHDTQSGGNRNPRQSFHVFCCREGGPRFLKCLPLSKCEGEELSFHDFHLYAILVFLQNQKKEGKTPS